jgi:hypothetical protein
MSGIGQTYLSSFSVKHYWESPSCHLPEPCLDNITDSIKNLAYLVVDFIQIYRQDLRNESPCRIVIDIVASIR